MTNYLVFLSVEPFYVKCVHEKEALEIATEYQDVTICIATSDSHITVKKPKLTMAFHSECDVHLDDYLGERLLDQLRDVKVDESEVLGVSSGGYLTERKVRGE